MISTQESDPELIYCFRGFNEKVVKLFLEFISHSSRRAWIVLPSGLGNVGPCFDPLLESAQRAIRSVLRALWTIKP